MDSLSSSTDSTIIDGESLSEPNLDFDVETTNAVGTPKYQDLVCTINETISGQMRMTFANFNI